MFVLVDGWKTLLFVGGFLGTRGFGLGGMAALEEVRDVSSSRRIFLKCRLSWSHQSEEVCY